MRRVLIPALALAAMAASACGGEAGGTSSAEGKRDLVWAVQPGNPTNISFELALESGLATDHDLQIEEVSATGGNANQIAAVQNGSADFFFATLDGLAVARQEGQKVAFFCGQIRTFALPLMATPDSGLKTLEEMGGDWEATVQQFEGLKLGVPARGSSFELRTVEILKSAGLSASDVTFVPVGIGPAVRAALEANQIDGLLSYPPDYMALEDEGLVETVVDANADGPPAFRDLFGVGFAATDEWIAENSDAAESLCEMQADVTSAINDGTHDEALREKLVSDYGIGDNLVEDVVASLKDDYYTAQIPEDSITKSIDMLEEGGAIKPGTTTFEDLVKPPA